VRNIAPKFAMFIILLRWSCATGDLRAAIAAEVTVVI